MQKRKEDILFYAFRYALGRKTYAVGIVADEIKKNWYNFKKETQRRIITEIKEAIKNEQAGMDCDVEEWQEILNLN